MKRHIYWWPLAKCLKEYLATQTIVDDHGATVPMFKGVDIYAGTKGKAREYPCVEITWESESDVKVAVMTSGTVVLWVDVCVECNDDDVESSYVLQDDIQEKIIGCLPKWAQYARDRTGVAPQVEVEEILSDGDINRPVSVARIVLSIDWRKC